MSEIRFRIAKPSDAKQIAECHWHVRDRYTQGIFLSLGKRFLCTYYKIILDDPWEVVVCAENEEGKIVGFSSATLDGREQATNLSNHKIRLGMSAAWSIICNPKLFKEVWRRYKSLNDDKAAQFVTIDGVRGEYWCWRKGDDSSASIQLYKTKHEILKNLGVKEIFFEVDKFNTQVYKFHKKVNRATQIEEIQLPDGRTRVLFKKTLI